jgi:hypothetical protein
MAKFVLCDWDQQYNRGTFVCSPHHIGNPPLQMTFSSDVNEATRFEAIDDAQLARQMMAEPTGGKERFRVYELQDDGGMVKVEP